VDRVLDAHSLPRRLAPGARRRPQQPPRPDVRSQTMEQATVSQRGRAYPPPASPEPFWPVQLALLAAIGLEFALPPRLAAGPFWLVPGLEGVLLVGLFFATPKVLEREHPRRRRAAITLIAIVSAGNIYSLAALTHFLLHHNVSNGPRLITAGVLIWLTNFVIFSLWYWELDRGGPGKRAMGHDEEPDFLFPQMTDDRIEPLDWRPRFLDYLYVSLTNATAFSPTDTMPLSVMAKTVMGVQALVSLVTIGLIVSRAVNII
jgi:uncharacterized membrane protein